MLSYQKNTDVALLFPGQGGHDLKMLAGISDTAEFSEYYPIVSQALGTSPLDKLAQGDTGYLNQNLVSSLLTVLSSAVCLERYVKRHGNEAHSLAGYSVGEWTALYAGGALSFEQLVRILKKRCELMDACFNERGGAMLGVIGVAEKDLAAFCREIEQEQGEFIRISNYNSPGQYSIAGSGNAIELALASIDQLRPKKALALPVSGAWHCDLLQRAALQFARYLAEVPLKQPAIPIIDNVTGKYLPTDLHQLKQQLAKHLSRPVRWIDGVRFLAGRGCKRMVEIGYGKVLTKFGFFIDFNLSHQSYYR